MIFSVKRSRNSFGPAFSIVPAAIAFTLLEGLVAAQAISAYQDRFLTVAQMHERGISGGLPFAWHFAMWSDALVISGLSAGLVGAYWREWRRGSLWTSAGIGTASSAAMNWLYTWSSLPEAHVQLHRLTTAGYLHFAYMALAIAIFFQFFVCTEKPSTKLLRFVSLALFAHVIVGTHMLLGIWSSIHPLEWYPARPLSSFFGWLTIAAAGIFLAWRNVFASAKFSKLGKLPLDAAFAIFEFCSGQTPRTTKGYLKFLDFFCGIALASSFYLKKVISLEAQTNQDQAPLILLSMIAIKYLLGRMSVTQELAIGESLFPPDRLPNDLKLNDRVKITIQVIGFMALYIMLGGVVDRILFVSGIMTILACGDFHTRDAINDGVRRRFSDRHFAPHRRESEYKRIMARRAVVEWFLFSLPHLSKELWVIYGSATAFGVALYGHYVGLDLNLPAYAILIGVHVINEVITVWWRIDRYVRLNAINR
jgi:hypothetical protein